MFLLGLLIGTFAFAGLYGPTIETLMGAAEVMAGDTVPDAYGIPAWAMVLAMAAALVFVFVWGGRFERASRGPVTAQEAVQGAAP